jgi:hypothetical protein
VTCITLLRFASCYRAATNVCAVNREVKSRQVMPLGIVLAALVGGCEEQAQEQVQAPSYDHRPVQTALDYLELVRALVSVPADSKPVEVAFVRLSRPALLRRDVVVPPQLRDSPAKIKVGVRRLTAADTSTPFFIDLSLNGVPLATIPGDTLPVSWTALVVDVPEGTLLSGTNSLVLSARDVSSDNYFQVYSTRHPEETDADDPSCHSLDDGGTWDCEDPAPHPSQRLEGFSLEMRVIHLPSPGNVDPGYHFLLDSDLLSLATEFHGYVYSELGPYFMNPVDSDKLDQLKHIADILRGRTPYETVRNALSFTHLALNYPRVDNTNQNAWKILFLDGGAWCSGNAFVIVALLALQGIDARVVELVHNDAASSKELGHVVAEAWLDGQWVMVDPFVDFMLVDGLLNEDEWFVAMMPSIPVIVRGYSVMDLWRYRNSLKLRHISEFPGFRPALASDSNTLDGLTMGRTVDQLPLRYLDFFNDRALVYVGGVVLPYYDERHPPRHLLNE